MNNNAVTFDDYHMGIIGNCHTGALIDKNGGLIFACMPNFDNSSFFASILDSKKGGEFRINVSNDYRISQKYIKNTNILLTKFDDGENEFDLIDFMPRYHLTKTISECYCPPKIIRYLRIRKGKPKIFTTYQPALNYARGITCNELKENYIKSHTQNTQYESAYLYSDIDNEKILNSQEIILEKDNFFILSYHEEMQKPSLEDVELEYHRTRVYWLDWVENSILPIKYRIEVIRSALTLKLLTFQRTGSVLAALTTSLPETINEVRNWDYRFCWIRDASMTISVMNKMGHKSSVQRYLGYILNILTRKDIKFKIMYGIRGDEDLTEYTLEHLAGYNNSKPVRIGNGAHDQVQNDIYGIFLDAVYLSLKYFTDNKNINEEIWTITRTMMRNVITHWKETDSGIWEIRGEGKHFVFSKLMCWVAADRGIKIAKNYHKNIYVAEWEQLAEEIKVDIYNNGWSEKKNSFVQHYGGEDMDASNLLMASLGFISADNPKYVSTVMRIKEELCVDYLMYRYRNEDDFGLPTSSFTICSFWMVEALILIGKKDIAKRMFEKLISNSNHLGLFSEDIDFKTKRLLGNFPQAYSHLALIKCAMLFSDKNIKEE